MNVIETSLYTFSLIEDGAVLKFDWTDQTADMDYEDFQLACSNFAGFAHEHQTKRLLEDVRNFAYSLPSEFETWREDWLNPRYHKLGVEKFAYILPVAEAAHAQEMPGRDGTFTTNFFADKDSALAWLNG